MNQRVRVLVVDDSAFARKVVREVLRADSRVEVVGAARDGLEALEKIAELEPDVVTLDLVMPQLDGLGVLRALPRDGPRVVLVSIAGEQSDLVIEGLQLGAVDFVRKPTGVATDRLYELGKPLVEKVLVAADAHAVKPEQPRVAKTQHPLAQAELVVVGTSTGGPQALTCLLRSLPADFPAALAMALHIPAEYTPAMARRLAQQSALEVEEAWDGMVLRPGKAVLAPGGVHLRIGRRGEQLEAQLTREPSDALYLPSVDVLFTSAARVCGPRTLGVVLTGMGDDGVRGAREIVDAGGRVLVEAESSSVVYGMPRAVREAGLAAGEAPIDQMGEAVVANL